MRQIESFEREDIIGSEPHLMMASTYNEMRLLFQRCGESCLFVPIRSMQYMAVIDAEEVIFVDSQRKRFIEFSWRRFNPQSRTTLNDPVPYEFVYYNPIALETFKRAQGEFSRYIHQMSVRKKEQNRTPDTSDSIIPFQGMTDD